MSLKSGMLRSSTFSPFLSVMTMSPQSPTPRPMAMTSVISFSGTSILSVLSGEVESTLTRLSVIL